MENPVLRGKERSELSKKIWRTRKRGPGKGTCYFCRKKIFAGGVVMSGHKFHKGCGESWGAGLTPAQAGKNPVITEQRRAPRDAFRYFGARELNPKKYIFGPTGYRPPAKWFSKMSEGAAASYFGKKLKDLTKSERAKVSQIAGGIWAKFSDATRLEILKKYEPSAVRVNPVQMLSCPACGNPVRVSRHGVYLKCPSCNTSLVSVKVRKN